MPELPEVETIRAGLQQSLPGHVIKQVTVFRDATARHQEGGPAALASGLQGMLVTAIVRRGKFMWWLLADEQEADYALTVHLGMSGQFRVGNVDRHVRARFHFDHQELSFCDQRIFGYLTLTDLVATADGHRGGQGAELAAMPRNVLHIGRDIFDPFFDPQVVVNKCKSSRAPIKAVLLNQQVMSGVGNIYADEALWRAQIRYDTAARNLTKAQIEALLCHTREVMAQALAVGGTSFDELYVNVDGQGGYFERELAVYGREGEKCRRCSANIVRERFAGRSSFSCPVCQPA